MESSNEELQTAKEELQSSNEELTTLNEELENRNLELAQVNDDLLNILTSIDVPVVMLDGHLRVRRFNPSHQYVHKKIVKGELKIQQEELRRTNDELQDKALLLVKQKNEVEAKNKEVEEARKSLEEKRHHALGPGRYGTFCPRSPG